MSLPVFGGNIARFPPTLDGHPLWLKAYRTMAKWLPEVWPIFVEHCNKFPWKYYNMELFLIKREDDDNGSEVEDVFNEDITVEYRKNGTVCVVVLYTADFILEMKYKPLEGLEHAAAA